MRCVQSVDREDQSHNRDAPGAKLLGMQHGLCVKVQHESNPLCKVHEEYNGAQDADDTVWLNTVDLDTILVNTEAVVMEEQRLGRA
ncbi:hypothetical protein HYR54_03640 [Candidatus Acetothermia bacterium]|nr:hypothetical protein [Candidatus Acetothermia bacterium]